MHLRNVVVTDEIQAEIYKRLLFGLTYDKDEVFKSAKGIAVIREGQFKYKFFDICFLHDMLSSILECIYLGYIPVFDLYCDDSEDGHRVTWTDYFMQPFEEYASEYADLPMVDSKEISDGFLISFIDYNFIRYRIEGELVWAEMAMRMYRDFVRLNSKCQNYADNELKNVLGDRRVLGAVCRGTDMNNLKLQGHPVQPSPEDVIQLSQKVMAEYKLDYIYIASEDENIVEMFHKEFANKLIVNRRHYYNSYYDEELAKFGTDTARITKAVQHAMAEDKEIDPGLEYLSSIVILSKCKALVGGNCGASLAACYMNMHNYEYLEIVDLGIYS